jgi:hypothetical protein
MTGAWMSVAAFLGSIAVSFDAASAARTADPAGPGAATVPFSLDHNRMTVEVEFARPDGTLRKAQAWVDLGSQHVLVAEPLARDLGLDLGGLQKAPREAVQSAPESPPLRVGGLALDVSRVVVLVRPGAQVRPGVSAEAMLPASVLVHQHVVFDYPAGRLTIARPGVLKPRGVPIPGRLSAQTGLLQVDATIGGETVALGVDNGSAGTWVSTTLTSAWQARHTDWPHAAGAAGSANFWGVDFEAKGMLLRVPEVGIGPLRVRDVPLLGVAKDLFDWYSTKSAGPVVGLIGANVLRGFRLEIDYPNRMTYWEAGTGVDPGDLDIVGLTIRVEEGGGFSIAGIVARNGEPTVAGIEPGDRLLRVDALDTTRATMGAVVQALRGKPGETRTLVVERKGTRITVEAKVVRLP